MYYESPNIKKYRWHRYSQGSQDMKLIAYFVIGLTFLSVAAEVGMAKSFEPPDRGAPERTGDAGTRLSKETPDLTGRGRPDDRRGGASKSQEGDYKPRDNGGPATSQGSGTRFTW